METAHKEEMKKVIAIVGMPGSGKSEAGVFFKKKEIPVLRFGSVVIEGLESQGKEINPCNEQEYRQQIRQEYGMAAIARKMLPDIEHSIQISALVILDGLYSWEEYLFLKEKLSVLLILCIYARPALRYKRLKSRRTRPFSEVEARNRDIAEISKLNKGGPIAAADYLIKNEGTKEELERELESFFEYIQKV